MSSEEMNLTTVMYWVVLACAVIGTVFTVIIVNRRKSPRPLPLEKPSLAFFPKYYVNLPSPEGQQGSLTTWMEKQGFRAVNDKSRKKQFERGSVLGDFSIKWTKVNVSEMDGHQDRLSIAYGGPVLFDTGDLWKFAREIQRILTSRN